MIGHHINIAHAMNQVVYMYMGHLLVCFNEMLHIELFENCIVSVFHSELGLWREEIDRLCRGQVVAVAENIIVDGFFLRVAEHTTFPGDEAAVEQAIHASEHL